MESSIWVTRDKELIAVSDMTTSHIINCIRMIQRNRHRNWRVEYLDRLELELQIRSMGLTSKRQS